MEARDLAFKILDEAREQIQANMAAHYQTSKGERWINASGRSSAAFQVVEEDGHVRLVYRGEDVAPFDSIQYGYKGDANVNDIAEWKEIKESQGATGIPSPDRVVERIREAGTERYLKPQEWVINPVVDLAVQALNDQLPNAYVRDLTQIINQSK